jgi:hypothetical protein
MIQKIGTLGGCKILLEGDSNEAIEWTKNMLGSNQYIFFDGYSDGHHPAFFEKYPQLEKYKK